MNAALIEGPSQDESPVGSLLASPERARRLVPPRPVLVRGEMCPMCPVAPTVAPVAPGGIS